MLLLSIWFTIRLILLVLVGYSCTVAQFIEPPDEESLQCTGTGMLMFQGDGRFSVVRENSNGSLMCTGDVSVAANSTLYTRIISKGIFVCKSSSSVRICGYGDVELANSETTGSNIDHSLFQCNGEPLFPIMDSQFTNTYCFGEGNFSIQGFGTFTIEADEITCIADKNMTILPTLCKVMGVFSCVGIGPYTISGYGRPLSMISESENCSHGSLLATLKHCSGLGEYSLIGDGSYNISTKSGNISCFGDITEYGLYFTTFGPFYCEGEDMFLLDGIGFLYQTNTTDYDNCSSLIDSTNPVSNNLSIFTACVGKGAHAFFGNGNFYVSVYAVSSNHGLKCDGSVSDTHTSNGTLYTYSYGQFRCVSSGDLLINGTGVIEGDDIHCAVSPITAGEIFECSGTGEFEIVGLGFFSIVAIPEITCTGNGDLLQFDIGEKFMSRGSFACIGSEFFTVTGTGEIESVTTVRGSHNCTDMPVTSGSGGIDVVTCSGEGDYIIVGDGSFYINQTGLGILQCSGEVISGVNTSQSAEYFINGEFHCAASGIIYFTGIGRAKIINASTSYECNGVFFPGPTLESPFSGFGGDDITCFAYGETVIVGYGQIQMVTQSTTPLDCKGAVSFDLDQNLAESNGDFKCTGNDFIHINGRGEVFINSTGLNNCTRRNNTINDDLLTPTTIAPTATPTKLPLYICNGEGNNFTIMGIGHFQLLFSNEDDNDVYCGGDLSPMALHTYQTFSRFYCYGSANFTIKLIQGDPGIALNIYVSADFHNCKINTPFIKFCSGIGEYSLIGEGSYNISTRFGNISCFGDITEYGLYFTTFGPFYCEGEDMFLLDGIGFLYQTNTTDYDNCSSLIDSTNPVSNNPSIFTACEGKGAHAFFGNGNFYVSVYAVSSNHGLKCDGSVSDTHTSKGTLYTYSYGQFCCVSSGDLLINGTGVIEGDDIHCAVSPITAGEIFECSGTGEFEIVGLGFFSIVAIPEITCTGNGDLLQFDIGEKFMSRGRFACIGSEFFTVTGTGEIESVTTVLGSHNCTDMPVTSGSGGIDVVTCSGEGDYIIVGDGSFYINQTGLGMLQCIGEVISGVNTSQSAEYFINGEFRCAASGIVYFTGIGRAKIINASTSYECNGVFFPGPIMEPPFSGFGGDDITCFAYGETVIVGYGQIHMVTQSPTPLDCKGTVSFDLDQNLVESNGDFMCTGNDFIHINGRGEVFVNSTGFNNCTPCNDTISDDPLSCSGFGEHEIFGSANATIFASDALECNGDVFPLTSSNGSLYYIGGCYRCTSHGSFSINGLGNATIHSTSGVSNYNCIGGPQLLNCATFAIDGIMDENVILIGVGEFTIIGDEKLYCKGNAVLCPGEINYYFTDGHFYCSSDVFVHINGTGTIENITGANNCSGFGFGVLPIASGALLTPQPSCIGFGNHYQINGNGTFDISRLIGSLNCNVRLQEPNSDVYTFSSIEELFNCSGNGIFVLDGFGDSFIILDNGYFNCVDTSVEPTSSFIDPTPDPTPSSIASTLSLIDPTSIATEPTSVCKYIIFEVCPAYTNTLDNS